MSLFSRWCPCYDKHRFHQIWRMLRFNDFNLFNSSTHLFNVIFVLFSYRRFAGVNLPCCAPYVQRQLGTPSSTMRTDTHCSTEFNMTDGSTRGRIYTPGRPVHQVSPGQQCRSDIVSSGDRTATSRFWSSWGWPPWPGPATTVWWFKVWKESFKVTNLSSWYITTIVKIHISICMYLCVDCLSRVC